MICLLLALSAQLVSRHQEKYEQKYLVYAEETFLD